MLPKKRKKMQIEYCCSKCEKIIDIEYIDQDYDAWKGGTMIQDAFPYLSTDEREIMQSGICGECFDRMYNYG